MAGKGGRKGGEGGGGEGEGRWGQDADLIVQLAGKIKCLCFVIAPLKEGH